MVRALTAYTGITTDDGAVDGTTMVDANLIGRNDFITEKAVLVMSGDARDEDKGAASFNSGTGEITLQGTGFSAQILRGTIYRILNISSVEIDVANINTKIGTNTDPAGTTTLFAWMARLFAQVAEATGIFSFDETSALEQTMVTVAITSRANIGGIWIDMVNVTQDTTIKVYHKIDGTNFREFNSFSWATTDSDGVLIAGFTAYRDIRVTLTCGGGGAGSVNVPYAIV